MSTRLPARSRTCAGSASPIGTLNLLLSIGLFWYTRSSSRNPRFLLDLGLGYKAITALSIGPMNYSVPGVPGLAGLSWIIVVILIFPAIVPGTPRMTLGTALLAASMDPFASGVWRAAGVPLPGLGNAFVLAIPNYLCAMLAAMISHIITGLAARSAARER